MLLEADQTKQTESSEEESDEESDDDSDDDSEEENLESEKPQLAPADPTGAVKSKEWSAEEFEMLETLVAKDGVGDWEEKAKLLGTGRTAKSLASKWFGWGRLGTRSTVAENKKPQHDKKKTAAKKGSDDSLTSHTETDSEEDSHDDNKEESEEEREER